MAWVGGALGAGAGLIGAIMDANARQQQANIEWSGLQETKRANRKTEDLARSSKRDAYGNVLKYTPGVGWEYDLTDITNSILSGEQKERRANLLEDAPRARAANVRKDNRSKMADEDFEKAFNEYRYATPRSEASDVTDATDSLLKARKKGLDESGALLSRQLIRTGMGSGLQGLYKDLGEQYSGSLEDAILKGKQLGRDNFVNKRNQDESAAQSKLGFLKGVADDSGGADAKFSSFNSDLSGRSDNAMQDLIRSIESGRSAAQNANSSYASAQGQTGLDLSALASALGRLDFSSEDDDEDQFPPAPATRDSGYFQNHSGLW